MHFVVFSFMLLFPGLHNQRFVIQQGHMRWLLLMQLNQLLSKLFFLVLIKQSPLFYFRHSPLLYFLNFLLEFLPFPWVINQFANLSIYLSLNKVRIWLKITLNCFCCVYLRDFMAAAFAFIASSSFFQSFDFQLGLKFISIILNIGKYLFRKNSVLQYQPLISKKLRNKRRSSWTWYSSDTVF